MGGKCIKASDPSDRYTAKSTGLESDPSVKPQSAFRKRVVPTVEELKLIDDHALKAPRNVANSVKSLAEYLTQAARTDVEKVRTFYRWITNNISYDTGGFRRKNNDDQQALSVLKRRQAVCEGYSTLFLELCREANIPCKKIHGFSKGLSYVPEVSFTEDSRTNHAWNIVYISGRWSFIDATWGAGRVTNYNTFEKHYEELYFLTDPEVFAVKHFPYMDEDIGKSRVLQLLKNPITLEEFNLAANPDTQGLVWGFESSHKKHKIEMNADCTVTFSTQKVKLKDVSCILKRKNSATRLQQCMLLRKLDKQTFTVKFSPPLTGTYQLEIFGKTEEMSGKSLSRMIRYDVESKSVGENVTPYPDHPGLWGIKENVDIEKLGFSSDLKSKDVLQSKHGTFEFRVKAKDRTKAIFQLKNSKETDLTKYCFGYIGKGFLTIRGNLPKEGYYKLLLLGNDNDGTQYVQMGEFLIECKTAHPDPPVYPLPVSLWGARHIAVDYGFTNQIHSKSIFTTGSGELDIRLPTTRDVNTSLKIETSRPGTGDLTKNAISFYSDKVLTIKTRLPKKGFYKLLLFANNPSTPNSKKWDHVAEFLIESKADAKETKPFPQPYPAAEKYSCVLIEPLSGVLPANQKVHLRLRSKILTKILINNESYGKKSGDLFEVTFTTPKSGSLPVCGNGDNESRFDWLYVYEIK